MDKATDYKIKITMKKLPNEPEKPKEVYDKHIVTESNPLKIEPKTKAKKSNNSTLIIVVILIIIAIGLMVYMNMKAKKDGQPTA